ncbi:aspartic peptidase domain-containing protein [Bisporella sp. PMI_857]|nr:aspartic peptidase domain-containing protein [Bisporella sp. PMI_857]
MEFSYFRGSTSLAFLLGVAQLIIAEPTVFPLSRSWDNDTYTIDVAVGNPKQNIRLAVDIGSYATFLVDNCSSLYFDEDKCVEYGTYNESLSTSSTYISTSYEESWLDLQDGDSHRLMYYADDFTIGGSAALKNITVGISDYPTTIQYGSLGLGFGKGINSNHSNIIDELQGQGITKTKAFSLTLDQNDIDKGSLIFGGVDTKKFGGALQKRPIQPAPDKRSSFDEYRYWFNVDNVTLNNPDVGSTTTVPGFTAMPQTINAHSYLPTKIVQTVASAFLIHNISDDSYGSDWYVINCEWRNWVNGSLDLQFGNLNISIPYRELVIRQDGISDVETPECYIGVLPRDEGELGDGIWYLGHAFLRKAYAVFDQESKSVWLAKKEDCGSEVVEIGTEDGAIASITGQCAGGLDATGGSSSTSNAGTGTSTSSGTGSTTTGDKGNASDQVRVSMAVFILSAFSWLALCS